MTYFRRWHETPADQGAAAAVDDPPPDENDETEAEEPARYSMEELAEHLGPTF